MGVCFSNQSSSSSIRRDTITTHKVGNLTFQVHSKFHLGVLTSGEGCKKTPAWETTATKKEVEKKREEFWDTRVEGSAEIWGLLRSAVAEDHLSAAAMIEALGLKMGSGSVMQIYDHLGNLYCLPPFVINEPLKYGTRKQSDKLSFEEKELEFAIRSATFGDFTLKISNSLTVKDLKDLYAKETARLFYNGRELIDKNKLGHYNLKDGVVVQALIQAKDK